MCSKLDTSVSALACTRCAASDAVYDAISTMQKTPQTPEKSLPSRVIGLCAFVPVVVDHASHTECEMFALKLDHWKPRFWWKSMPALPASSTQKTVPATKAAASQPHHTDAAKGSRNALQLGVFCDARVTRVRGICITEEVMRPASMRPFVP